MMDGMILRCSIWDRIFEPAEFLLFVTFFVAGTIVPDLLPRLMHTPPRGTASYTRNVYYVAVS